MRKLLRLALVALAFANSANAQNPGTDDFANSMTVWGGVRFRDIADSGESVYVRGPKGTASATYSIHWPVDPPAVGNVLAVDGTDAQQLVWSAGSFSCSTANDCVNITGTQTVTGLKTINNSLDFTNDQDLRWQDATGTPVILATLGTDNEFHIGLGFNNVATGGGTNIYAGGGSGGDVHLKLHWLGAGAGVFAPESGHVVDVGTTTVSGLGIFDHFRGHELILHDPGAGRGVITFWDDTETDFLAFGAPATMAAGDVLLVLPEDLPAVGDTMTITADYGAGQFQLNWEPSGSCSTASNCVTLDGAQTITGLKTINNVLDFTNNKALRWQDSTATPVTGVILGSNNEFHVGLGFNNVPTGGGLNLYAAGGSSSPVHLKLHWLGANAGVFAPESTETVELGTTTVSGLGIWQRLWTKDVQIRDPGTGRSVLGFWDDSNSATLTFGGPATISGGTIAMVLPDDLPAVGDTLTVITDLGARQYQLAWEPGGGVCGGNFACLDAENIFTGSPQTISTTTENARLLLETDFTGAAAVLSGFMYSGASAPTGFDMAGLSARGSKASPTAVQDQDMFFRLSGAGYDGSTHGNAVEIRGRALGTFSGSNHGGKLTFGTASQGSTTVTERMAIGVDNSWLRVGPTVTPLAPTKLLVSASGETTQATLYGDAAQAQVIRVEKGDSTAWSLYRPGSSSEFRFFHSAIGDLVAIESDGDFRLTRNNVGFWINDTGGTAIRQVWMDGSNNLNLGPSNQVVPSGGDTILWAAGTVASGQIGMSVDWTGSNNGVFHPISGDSITIGTNGVDAEQPTGVYTKNTVQINSSGGGFIAATLSIEDLSDGGAYTSIRRASGGSTHTLTLPNANAAGALTNDGAGNLSWSIGGGSFTCNTASNCFNLTDAQTAAGNKILTGTLSVRNTLSVQSSGGSNRAVLQEVSSQGRLTLVNASGISEMLFHAQSSSSSGQNILINNSSGSERFRSGVIASGGEYQIRLTGLNTVQLHTTSPAGLAINGNMVVTVRQLAVASPSADVTSLKTAVDAIRARLIAHGLISP